MLARLWSSPTLLLVIPPLCWSGNFVVGRAVHGHVPPMALSFWRWTIAFLLVVGFAAPHLRRDLPLMWRQRVLVGLLAFFGISCFNALVYFGLASTTVVNGVLMQSVLPVTIIAGSFAIFGEKIRLLQAVAILVSLAGVAVVITRGSMETVRSLSLSLGDGLIFLAVISYAIYSVLLRKRPSVHPLSFIAVIFLVGAILLLPALAWEIASGRTLPLDATSLLSIAYVAVFPSIVAYLCFNRGVELIGANRAGQFAHLMPVFGTLLAAVFLGERLEISHLAGAALIALGIAISQVGARG
jgi:drug/metabolite transporter (DMT)-like permease